MIMLIICHLTIMQYLCGFQGIVVTVVIVFLFSYKKSINIYIKGFRLFYHPTATGAPDPGVMSSILLLGEHLPHALPGDHSPRRIKEKGCDYNY